ncbi:MAG: ABC-2 transporter permease [Lachnospiraceae bacterium]|nr:ABC-2 transporter permease [Lachnospiraceae bacterium]
MKGLFIKDIMAAWKFVLFSNIAMVLMVMILEAFSGGEEIATTLLLVCIWLIMINGNMIAMGVISEEERSKFDMYTMILPIDRRKAALEKFIMSACILGEHTLFGTIITILVDKSVENVWWIVYIAAPISLITNAIGILMTKLLGANGAIIIDMCIVVIIDPVLAIISGVMDSVYRFESVMYNNRWLVLIVSMLIYGVIGWITCNIKEEC